MMNTIPMLTKFLADPKAFEMFITGRAGTGKTTTAKSLVQHLMDNSIDYVVCAFTHKACNVLASKLPNGAKITTLHSYLKKRPGINEHATRREHVSINSVMGLSEKPTLVIVDEYSMVGEKDYMDLVAMQDPQFEGDPYIKVLYIGDPYQLPPVGDMQTIRPRKPYWLELVKVYRTNHVDLLDAMAKCIEMLNGSDLEPIRSSKNLVRGQDLVKSYKASASADKVCLAWTNKAVQRLNTAIAGKSLPDPGDNLWNATLRHELVYEGTPDFVDSISTAVGYLPLGTKYKTLEFLLGQPEISFAKVYNQTLEEEQVIAYIFGHYNYKLRLQELTDAAVQSNSAIVSTTNGANPAEWSRNNHTHKLAKERSLAWRKLISFKESVCCVDFTYAMTVHKSQGSTYDEVYLDSEDLSKCGETNMEMYLKLFYVAISRASKKVVTN